MIIPKTLKPFYDYNFDWQPKDFNNFAAKFKRIIEKELPEGYSLHSFNKGYFYVSGVIKSPGEKFIYFSISDVRFFGNKWATDILYRTMAHDKDWTEGQNHYTSIADFKENI